MRQKKPLYLLLTILFVSLIGCKEKSEYRYAEGIVWNTVYHITYNSDKNLDDSIRVVLDRVNSSLSMFNDSSTLARINRGDSIPADRMLREVYELSAKMNKATDGAFDPTVGALVNAWGFGPEQKPDSVAIQEIMLYTGFDKTNLTKDGYIHRTDPRIRLDFAAIAKGYGVDEVAKMLKRNGVEDFLVEIGGEIVSTGKSSRGDEWTIGIDRPVWQSDTIIHSSQTMLQPKGRAVATSGNYRNFYINDSGEKVGHTINPKTGMSVTTDILSATVLAPSCAEADAMATACMVLGSERAVSMLKRLGYGYYLVLADGSSLQSKL